MKVEFTIPKSAKYVFVADMFAEDFLGGAELTTEVLFNSAPEQVFKLHSASLTDTIVSQNPDKTWILFNWTQSPMEGLVELVNTKARFFVVEYDYKYCSFRSSHLHLIHAKTPCDCERNRRGQFVSAFYRKAQHVFFMSEGQRKEYFRVIPKFESVKENFSVLSSLWNPEDFSYLEELKEKRTPSSKWAILKGGSWIKNQEATEKYCKENGIPYGLVGGLPFKEFLRELSQYEGLVFHPAGFDTCPRLVVEARMMGLKLNLNENVQHSQDAWWQKDEQIQGYLKSRPEYFWKIVA